MIIKNIVIIPKESITYLGIILNMKSTLNSQIKRVCILTNYNFVNQQELEYV